MHKSFVTLFFIMVSFCHVQAQFQGPVYESFQNATLTEGSYSMSAPWCGGVNATQLSLADLNQDGKNDLVLYDHLNLLVRTFINTGSAGNPRYTYAPKYETNFPEIWYYLILKDYNCDGIPDLFHKGIFGVSVYKGYYQNNELKFTFYRDLFFPGQNGPVNVYVQPGDIPAIVDIDKDGDLDILSFEVLGAQLPYYRNMRVEEGLPCDSMRMVLSTNCWGQFYQTIYQGVILNSLCKGNEGGSNKKQRHTGNCIEFLDIEGDGDLDFIGGNITFSTAQLLFNNGSGIVNAQDTMYNMNGHVLNLPVWPVPNHVDFDQDGDKDLLFSVHTEGISSANYETITLYKNLGTDANPNFVYQHDTLLMNDMIDRGSYSYPSFFDFNKDGKPDLFVGSEGMLNNSTGQTNARLSYYKNTSSSGNISFELVTHDFLGMGIFNFPGIFPTFGDVTGDNIADLVFGTTKGTIGVYKNYAANNSVTPNFLFMIDSLPGVFVSKHSTPAVYDVDQDGKTDLLVGERSGRIALFRDTSSTSTKKLALTTINYGNIKSGSASELFGFSAPTIAKMDNLEKEYLVVGNIDGTIERYDSFTNNWGTIPRIDSNYSFIKVPNRSAPAIADIDGDGKYEMLVGNKLGGLRLYKQMLTVTDVASEISSLPLQIQVYPNPADDGFYVLYLDAHGARQTSIRLFDLSGRLVINKTFHLQTQLYVPMNGLQSGLYLCEISADGKKAVRKIFKK